ncbi:MAG: winged helix-turn-helix transcriptional regulator [Firmicutes bacterium]|nr:winged helix-turn-helix transcriptional regulator [Bacillota bacterium]
MIKYDICETCECSHKEIVSKAKREALSDAVIYDLADVFKVFGDSTRIKILYALLNQEMCVGDLVEALDMTQSAISHQLRVLRQNDLVKYRKEGKAVIYSLDDEHVSVLLQQGLCHIMHKNKYDEQEVSL